MSIEFIIVQSLIFIIPLLIVALAGMFSERSGIVNIALEGLMVIGAFAGTLFIHFLQKTDFFLNNPQLLLFLAVIVAALSGALFSLLLGFLAINMKADQTIGGTAINLLAAAFVLYLMKWIINDTRIPFQANFQLRSNFLKPLGPINYIFFDRAYITTYLGILILVVAWFIFKYTKFGLRLSSCGEHPQAAQAAGINVIKYRYIGVVISGLLSGVGGLIYVITSSVSFSGSVAGTGFLALAVLIFGQWRPFKVFLASVIFGVFKALSVIYFGFDFIANWIEAMPNVPIAMFFRMIPYIVTMVVLAITSKKSRAPKAAGIPF